MLSPRERDQLGVIESALAGADPVLARSLRTGRPRRRYNRVPVRVALAVLAVVLLAVGFAAASFPALFAAFHLASAAATLHVARQCR